MFDKARVDQQAKVLSALEDAALTMEEARTSSSMFLEWPISQTDKDALVEAATEAIDDSLATAKGNGFQVCAVLLLDPCRTMGFVAFDDSGQNEEVLNCHGFGH